MGFQRARWHSGLTYRQSCPTCKAIVNYTDYNLDFRPWYADGYVDCPRCRTHLRHNEEFAIRADGTPLCKSEIKTKAEDEKEYTENYCRNCGNKFGDGHRFCNLCGTRRT